MYWGFIYRAELTPVWNLGQKQEIDKNIKHEIVHNRQYGQILKETTFYFFCRAQLTHVGALGPSTAQRNLQTF